MLSSGHIVTHLPLLLCYFVLVQTTCKPRDCVDLKCLGVSQAKDGPHTIYPDLPGLKRLNVSCDQTTKQGGWIVFQRRKKGGTVNFERQWADYKYGFGEQGYNTELWLGNENVYQIMQTYGNRTCELRIEAYAFNGNSCWFDVEDFSLGNETEFYSLKFENLTSGNAPIYSFEVHRNMAFRTPDHFGSNFYDSLCFDEYPAGWWFTSYDQIGKFPGPVPNCHLIYLNGPHRQRTTAENRAWIYVSRFANDRVLAGSVMMFRPTDATSRPCFDACSNRGPCEYIAADDTHRCVCEPPHCGARCEDKDTCRNGGTCVYDTNTKANMCKCTAEFTGPTCIDLTTTTTTTTTTTLPSPTPPAILPTTTAAAVLTAATTTTLTSTRPQTRPKSTTTTKSLSTPTPSLKEQHRRSPRRKLQLYDYIEMVFFGLMCLVVLVLVISVVNKLCYRRKVQAEETQPLVADQRQQQNQTKRLSAVQQQEEEKNKRLSAVQQQEEEKNKPLSAVQQLQEEKSQQQQEEETQLSAAAQQQEEEETQLLAAAQQ